MTEQDMYGRIGAWFERHWLVGWVVGLAMMAAVFRLTIYAVRRAVWGG